MQRTEENRHFSPHEIDLCSPYADTIVKLDARGAMSELVLNEQKPKMQDLLQKGRRHLLSCATKISESKEITVGSPRAIVLKKRHFGKCAVFNIHCIFNVCRNWCLLMILLLFISGS